MPMQINRFEATGGFVIHMIVINEQVYSAWFKKDGTLIDAERRFTNRYGNMKTKSVSSKMIHIRSQLEIVGQVNNPNNKKIK
jgi:hypothetical protein